MIHQHRRGHVLGSIILVILPLIFGSACGRGVEPTLNGPPAVTQTSDGSALAGTRWSLESYGPADAPVLPKQSAFTAEFDDQQMRGRAGCNSYYGYYSTTGERFTATQVTHTLVACEITLMEQENAYLAALRSVSSFQRNGNALTLTYPGGVLRYTTLVDPSPIPGQPLEQTPWKLTTFVTSTIAQTFIGVSITARFEGGQVSGSAGCNTYSASYSIAGDTLTIRDIQATKMACEAGMQAEQAFLSALRAVTSARIVGNQLTLTHVNGELIFIKDAKTVTPTSAHP